MTDEERAAIAREVLAEVEALLREGDHDAAADVVELHAAQYAPAAPETVTVFGKAWKRIEGGRWCHGTVVLDPSNWAHDLLDRIAADARRIAELQDEIANSNKHQADELESWHQRVQRLERERDDVVREAMTYKCERDEARRALEEKSSTGNETTTQFIPVNASSVIGASSCNVAGCRCGEMKRERDAMEARQTLDAIKARAEAAFASATTSQGEGSEVADTDSGTVVTPAPPSPGKGDAAGTAPLQSPSPAPIPLDASFVNGDVHWRRVPLGWEVGDKWYSDHSPVAELAYAYYCYCATPPTADAATVERVAEWIYNATDQANWRSWQACEGKGKFRDCARAALRALGYTVEGEA